MQGIAGSVFAQEPGSALRVLFDLAAIDGLNDGMAGGKMAREGAYADAGFTRDLVQTEVWAAFVGPAGDVGGQFCEDCHVAEITEDQTTRSGVRAYALDGQRAKALWAKSETMVGEVFEG